MKRLTSCRACLHAGDHALAGWQSPRRWQSGGLCRCSSMARVPVFQAGYAGSTPVIGSLLDLRTQMGESGRRDSTRLRVPVATHLQWIADLGRDVDGGSLVGSPPMNQPARVSPPRRVNGGAALQEKRSALVHL